MSLEKKQTAEGTIRRMPWVEKGKWEVFKEAFTKKPEGYFDGLGLIELDHMVNGARWVMIKNYTRAAAEMNRSGFGARVKLLVSPLERGNEFAKFEEFVTA